MSRMKDKLLEVEELILQGFSCKEVSDRLGVPLQWAIDKELELIGPETNDYLFDCDYQPS